MAKAEGIAWPPPPAISLRKMLFFFVGRPMQVKSVNPTPEPCPAQTSLGAGYLDAPPALLDPASNGEGRLVSDLRAAAKDRDGNKILQRVAQRVAANYSTPGATSQELITAMTQLAVTGSNAFAAWSAAPTRGLTSTLVSNGMPASAAATASGQIMSDFNAALQAVRNPGAGINETSLRAGLGNGNWIAVSGEDDSPDFPVNVAIAPFPQYHVPITVPTPDGPSSSINVSIRCIVASAQSATLAPCRAQFKGVPPSSPQIPPGDEIVLFLHGEGSRAEEALDFIPALFSAGAAAGRSFTVIAFDQPSTAYSTMVPHVTVGGALPVPFEVDTSSFSGSPLLDFVYNTVVTFVETFVVPFGNPITAVVGGSLGGHMALRLAASEKAWVRNVVAWSPACVMDHNFFLGFTIPILGPVGVTLSQRQVADPKCAGLATAGEGDDLRAEFFSKVWDQATFTPPSLPEALAVAAALVSAGAFAFLGVAAAGAATLIAGAILGLPEVPAQPLLWYRDDWPTGAPTVPLAPWGPAVSVGPAKAIHVQEARRDRREIYNATSRQWHWRICEEMLGFKFDALVPSINKPLLLMVGESDNYPEVHFLDNVTSFAKSLSGLGQCITVQDTGHSIHNERPYFLADQVIAFAPRF
jgi:pimeloyl-ACP methyl ester carboxylesterase